MRNVIRESVLAATLSCLLTGCYPNVGYTETYYDDNGDERVAGEVGWELDTKKGFQPAKLKPDEPLREPPPMSEMVGNPPASP